MNELEEKQTIRKIFFRIVPMLMLLYFISYIDRINVGFAALTMNKDIGLSTYMYGWGAGIFFIGYFIFEIPSNMMMEKFGARRWFARILFTWGILSCAMALVEGEKSFLILRFLLGAAEAGFFPGVILYLTYWFPTRYRARIVAAFTLAVPISVAVGAPLSTWLLTFDGVYGLKGWQWLFLIEGLPAVIATAFVLKYLTDKPTQANWLTSAEKDWLQKELDADEINKPVGESVSLAKALVSPAVIALAFIWFCNTGANLGLSFFLPQVIKLHGFSTEYVGYITAIPYIAGCFGMILCGYLSDKLKAPRALVVIAMLLTSASFVTAGLLPSSNMAILALSLAAVGILGTKAPFWVLSSSNLDRKTSAAGIAFINSVGNLGGFAGPVALGYLRDTSDNFSTGLYALSLFAMFAVVVAIFVLRSPIHNVVSKAIRH